jgi:hypothetical protein
MKEEKKRRKEHHKKKKASKKDHKKNHRKERKRSRSSSSSSSSSSGSSDEGGVRDRDGAVGQGLKARASQGTQGAIGDEDFFLRSEEFRVWLKMAKNMCVYCINLIYTVFHG